MNLWLLVQAHLEPNSNGYVDPSSFNTNSFPEYKLQLRTPPVLGFPRTQTGGADFWPKAAIKAAANCLKCMLWFNVIQDEFIAHWLNTFYHGESFYHHDSLVFEDSSAFFTTNRGLRYAKGYTLPTIRDFHTLNSNHHTFSTLAVPAHLSSEREKTIPSSIPSSHPFFFFRWASMLR